MLLLLARPQSRIPHAIVVVSLLVVVPPVRGEWCRLPSSTEYGERKNEADDLRPTVHTGAKDVVVFDEPVRAVLAQPELREQTSSIV